MSQQPSKVIQEARHFLQLNQTVFAKQIGKTQTTLSRYESGKVEPPSSVLMHCTHILTNDDANDEIEQIIDKVRTLDGEQHKKFREALNVLLDNSIF